MIRVKRPRLPPAGLSDAAARREREEVEAFYAQPENQDKRYPKDYAAYSHPTVKKSLAEAFHGKCAYCETVYEASHDQEVEHYRPKGAVLVNGELEVPGYWWLASEWTNLLPSCTHCNQTRKQELQDGREISVGKKNQFPIANPGQRATAPGEEKREKRLLIDPCRDWPDKHLSFTVHGKIQASSRKGEESIRVYALDRIKLIRQRRLRLRDVLPQLKKLDRLNRRCAQVPNDDFIKELRDDQIEEIHRMKAANGRYAAIVRQLIDEYFAGLAQGRPPEPWKEALEDRALPKAET